MITIRNQQTARRRIAPRCRHDPLCPAAGQPGDLAAKIVVDRPEQGWNLLCNGILTFEDGGAVIDGHTAEPKRTTARFSSTGS